MAPVIRQEGSLEGVQVIVTRPEGEDGPLACLLAEKGAKVLHWPVVTFKPPRDPVTLERALERLSSYDWIIFTSPRAVTAVEARVSPPAGRPRVAAIGESTAAELRNAGWRVDLIPTSTHGEGLVKAFARFECAGSRMLFPASSIARPTVLRGLEALGAGVEQVVAYRAVRPQLESDDRLAVIDTTSLAIVTFASPSAIDGLRSVLGRKRFDQLLSGCSTVVIGPTTARALQGAGFTAAATAEQCTLLGLARAAERVASDGRGY
ncbi:MAG: uroporphyrinogen-III synthase [Thermoanaerobaculia bacterium]